MSTNASPESQQAASSPDRVQCLSGHTYADRPTAIIYRGQERQIAEILDRWQIPGGRCFRVRVDDDAIFELCYEEMSNEWQIVAL